MNHQYDCLVIGAGLAGSVAARELAERGGKRGLVLERRNHVGGNAYDCFDEAGGLIHQYGPHIFHTNSTRVFDYLSRFTRWRPYEHQVVANLPDGDGRLEYPVPFNLVSLRAAFPPEKARALAEKLVSAYGMEKKVTILELRQNPDPELSALADYVYGHVFVRYTMKQWGQTPEEIDPNTTARVPVFLSEDCRYFQDAYQGMPLEGYTPMFQSLLDHPDITVELGVDAASRLTLDGSAALLDGRPFSGPIIYTGAADELFGCKYGRLPYRTLDFRFETLPQDDFQGCGRKFADEAAQGVLAEVHAGQGGYGGDEAVGHVGDGPSGGNGLPGVVGVQFFQGLTFIDNVHGHAPEEGAHDVEGNDDPHSFREP